MTILGATGHQMIPSAARDPVVRGVRSVIRGSDSPLRVVTSLAAGADQLVAGEVLAAGGQLDVVLPCRGYEHAFSEGSHIRRYHELLGRAADVESLDYDEPTEEAFWAAGKRVVERCQILLAVWDGAPAQGLGGTADVVSYARQQNVAVRIIWPAGVTR